MAVGEIMAAIKFKARQIQQQGSELTERDKEEMYKQLTGEVD